MDWRCAHGYYHGNFCPDCDVPSYLPSTLAPSYYTHEESLVYEEKIPFDAEFLGDCSHCGERVWTHDDPGECAHGVAHGQCILDRQSIGECEGVA